MAPDMCPFGSLESSRYLSRCIHLGDRRLEDGRRFWHLEDSRWSGKSMHIQGFQSLVLEHSVLGRRVFCMRCWNIYNNSEQLLRPLTRCPLYEIVLASFPTKITWIGHCSKDSTEKGSRNLLRQPLWQIEFFTKRWKLHACKYELK